ncbi:hypothetical protein chiPu_0023067 [Chiloscyllium punctatum]|uniref:Uncharacterized protein n=1 Tax=Chiloscyllium punctatum TaxID=137246 RepID=A0A401T9U1_CHIPU|nr:hypothetical protein [Chiloscyllium punctatum]
MPVLKRNKRIESKKPPIAEVNVDVESDTSLQEPQSERLRRSKKRKSRKAVSLEDPSAQPLEVMVCLVTVCYHTVFQ